MKTRLVVSILNFIFAMHLINGCATTPKNQTETKDVSESEFYWSVKRVDIAEDNNNNGGNKYEIISRIHR